jgi:hypothetical protein
LIAQERREWTKSEETVFEEALQLAQLTRGDGDAFASEGVAERRRELVDARAPVVSFA